ncbi:uncharacterized protein TrAFT101_006048 [Trichoderma asperellum]|uniref:uncharacterized protein n=1 Tax=Trichoderma asperellum TaxID=101201 RepID=UPI00331C870E|nr:hypothetical protein TrAFT101_006048 [Trichoderma asperellum]
MSVPWVGVVGDTSKRSLVGKSLTSVDAASLVQVAPYCALPLPHIEHVNHIKVPSTSAQYCSIRNEKRGGSPLTRLISDCLWNERCIDGQHVEALSIARDGVE